MTMMLKCTKASRHTYMHRSYFMAAEAQHLGSFGPFEEIRISRELQAMPVNTLISMHMINK